VWGSTAQVRRRARSNVGGGRCFRGPPRVLTVECPRARCHTPLGWGLLLFVTNKTLLPVQVGEPNSLHRASQGMISVRSEKRHDPVTVADRRHATIQAFLIFNQKGEVRFKKQTVASDHSELFASLLGYYLAALSIRPRVNSPLHLSLNGPETDPRPLGGPSQMCSGFRSYRIPTSGLPSSLWSQQVSSMLG